MYLYFITGEDFPTAGEQFIKATEILDLESSGYPEPKDTSDYLVIYLLKNNKLILIAEKKVEIDIDYKYPVLSWSEEWNLHENKLS